MTNISASLREKLKEVFICSSIQSCDEYVSADGTRKYTLSLTDGNVIECVLIPSGIRVTACISSQAGCPLACAFCATGQLGFRRNLDASEIHDQIMLLMNFSKEKYHTELDNIVVMGMGEPLLNYDNVMSALGKIADKKLLNFSPQRITLSTAGIVEGIKQMADENSPYHLALSLHSAIEHKRKSMMPIAKKYPLVQLIEALKYYHRITNNRITIEYILFDKLNDALEDAEALAAFCRNFPVKINIISYNATSGNTFQKSKTAAITAFVNFLKNKNIIVNLRASKGNDIMAACGQLAMNKNKKEIMKKEITLQQVKDSIRNVPDFPKPGILFKDITTALKDPDIFHYIVDTLANHYKDSGISKVVGIESRGFIVAGALADRLNAGFVPIRKPGKLPAPTFSKSYTLEYGENILHIHQDALEKDDVVLLHDDLLATGGSARAASELIRLFPIKKLKINFLCELAFLNGKSIIDDDIDVFSLVTY